jgi:hypothetical protein
MKKALLWVGGLSVLGYGLYRYFKYQLNQLLKYTWKLETVKNIKFGKDNISWNFSILFTSQSDIEAEIEKLYLDLYLGGANVGFVEQQKGFIIPARGSSSIPLFTSINPKAILGNAINFALEFSRYKDMKFTIDGYAKIKSGFLRTTLPIKYETTVREYFGL